MFIPPRFSMLWLLASMVGKRKSLVRYGVVPTIVRSLRNQFIRAERKD